MGLNFTPLMLDTSTWQAVEAFRILLPLLHKRLVAYCWPFSSHNCHKGVY